MPRSAPCGVSCIGCGSDRLRVVDSRAKLNIVYRRRLCKDCGARFSTAEEVVAEVKAGAGIVTQSEQMREAVSAFMAAFARLNELMGANGGGKHG